MTGYALDATDGLGDRLAAMRHMRARVAAKVGLVLVLGSCPAFAAEPVVAIVEATTNDAPVSIRPKIGPAAAQGVRAAGARPVQQTELGVVTATDCASASCIMRLAAPGGASHVLRVDTAYAKDGFRLQVEMYDGATGRKLGSGIRDCDICTGPEYLKAIEDISRKLCADTLVLPEAASPASNTTTGSSVTATPPLLAPASTAVAAEPARAPSSRLRKASWVAFIAGGVAVATGVGFLATDGRKTDCEQTASGEQCWQLIDNGTRGWALVGVGAAFAVAGGVMFAISSRSSSGQVALGIGPGGLKLGGTF